MQRFNIVIDASSIVDGGGFTHLYEFINSLIKCDNDLFFIQIYASDKVLNLLPNSIKIEKKSHKNLNRGILARLFFQLIEMDKFLNNKCDILFNLTGDYLGNFRPYISMSQNMLLYERRLWFRMRSLSLIIKYYLLFQRQKKCLINADGIIFLSKYAEKTIKKRLKLSYKKTKIINHGINKKFLLDQVNQNELRNKSFSNPFRFLYVSTIYSYKNQIEVLKAIMEIRSKGFPVSITFVGNTIDKRYSKKFLEIISSIEKNSFIKHFQSINYESILEFYKECDGIIFASSCENMPFVLIESMATGKPIASSNKGPMKEFLKQGGYYFNPENYISIANSLIHMLKDFKNWEAKKNINQIEIKKYNWEKTSKQTIDFMLKLKSEYDLRKSRKID